MEFVDPFVVFFLGHDADLNLPYGKMKNEALPY